MEVAATVAFNSMVTRPTLRSITSNECLWWPHPVFICVHLYVCSMLTVSMTSEVVSLLTGEVASAQLAQHVKPKTADVKLTQNRLTALCQCCPKLFPLGIRCALKMFLVTAYCGLSYKVFNGSQPQPQPQHRPLPD